MLQGVKLSKTQNPTTAEYIERMKVIPYDSAIGSIKYAMLCTRPAVCLAMSSARGYNKLSRSRSLDQNGIVKKEFLPMLQGVKLSKTQNPTTAEDRERMKVIPYASAIGSIKYAMLCTRPIVYLAMSLARGYNSDPGVDHWTAVKIILSYIKD